MKNGVIVSSLYEACNNSIFMRQNLEVYIVFHFLGYNNKKQKG